MTLKLFLRSPRVRFLFADPGLCLQLHSDSLATGTLVMQRCCPLCQFRSEFQSVGERALLGDAKKT